MSIYEEKGYRNRAHYLDCLAEECGVCEEDVKLMASIYGPAEDFDALVSHFHALAS